MSVFRLAHLSDLHFGATADRRNPIDAVAGGLREKSRAALSHILRRKLRGGLAEVTYPSTYNSDVAFSLLPEIEEQLKSCDALIVTGDLATTGSDTDLSIARAYFSGRLSHDENPLAAPLPALDSIADCVLLALPGNHDRYAGTALLPDSRRFESYFGSTWDFSTLDSSRGSTYDLISLQGDSRVKLCLLRKENARQALAMISADFSLDYWLEGDGNFGWVGKGRVVKQILYDLEETTRKIKHEMAESGAGAAALWAIHFPPCFPNIDENLQLIGGEELVDSAAALGIKLILAGHTHTPLKYDPHGSVRVLCGGTTTGIGYEDHHFYSLIDIEVDGEITDIRVILRRWDRFDEEFVSAANYPSQAA